ncbi:MAG: SDR family oxidoreductase [Cyclobacteriaceae bacterium]|nr:SDR family oxidoreductase [Cyclobacteriaceae bacterium]
MAEFLDKNAVITGGASGIGKAIAQSFANEGATVWILEVNGELARAFVEELTKEGKRAHYIACDVANQKEVKLAIEQINKSNSIDILINNAGIAHVGDAESTSEEDFDRISSVNIKGVYNMLHVVIPIMKKQGGGVILNMASVASQLGISSRFAYSASKGAVLAMTYSVAKDFVHNNIRCNSVSPGRVHTPFVDGFIAKNYPGKEQEMFDALSKTQPIGRMGKPEEIADLVLFLCSDKAGFITGTDVPIDGGFIKLNS